MKFIVVDDNKTFRESMKYYLESVLNQDVIGVAADGYEFLDLKNKHLADIILIDIEMPNLNGILTAKKALAENNFLKLIAITSYTEKAYLRELICAGFKACIIKDSIYAEFEQTIATVMAGNLKFPLDIIKG